VKACNCFDQYNFQESPPDVLFHNEIQDRKSDAWQRLLDLIEIAAVDEREELNPGQELGWENWVQVFTLPPTISKLKHVKKLIIAGSNLVRLPPEIGDMASLEMFDAYMAYRLHWYPFEITRCKHLVSSSASTRALYGNFKYRPPFPKLQPDITSTDGMSLENLSPKIWGTESIENCSVCNRPLKSSGLYQRWISLRVATDVLPLLVNACSIECIQELPKPKKDYVQDVHKGGLEVKQHPTYDQIIFNSWKDNDPIL
jgi:hypothetical protein